MNLIKPMLAVPGKVFSSKEWIFEPKIDGSRCIAYISNGSVQLCNRRQNSIAFRYPEVVKALKQSAGECILDGELTIFSRGVPDFSSLAIREQQIQSIRIDYLSRELPASYIVFDILYKDGESLMDLSLLERKLILKKELQESSIVTIIDYMNENGTAYFLAARKKGLEGVMAKRAASQYMPGVRSKDWIKIKKSLTLDLVAGGYIPGKGERAPFFGGLLLGAYDSGKLIYTGRVGSGFSREDLAEISQEFQPSDSSPFFRPPVMRGVSWLKPELVVEVQALEVSLKGHLRAPVYLARKPDKSPEECTIDQLQLVVGKTLYL